MTSISFCVVTDIVLSTCLWTAAYGILCWYDKNRHSYEWCTRAVTFVHAYLVVVLSAWCGFIQGPWPFTDPG